MTRYRQPDPPRRSGWRTALSVLGWLIVSLLVIAVGLAGGVGLWFHDSQAAIAPHSQDVIKASHILHVPLPGKPATAIVIGYDHRSGEQRGVPSRSDTIMLLRADPKLHTLSMLSFPRDLLTTIYCPGRLPYQDRINAAYSECGSRGTVDTVHRLTGLDINYLITVNFHGFTQVVDRLGGVWIDVDRRYFNDNAGLAQGYTFATINLQPGYQKLNGADALDFVRYRHTDSDLYRVARQQAFVKAAKLQLSSFSLLKIPSLINAITSNTEVAQAGAKGIPARTMISYALFLHTLSPGHFFQPKIEGLQDAGPSGAELSGTQDEIDQAVQSFIHPDVHASSEATNSALGRKSRRPKTLSPAQISITTLNGNGVTNSATDAASALRERGYTIVPPASGHPANAPNWNYFHTNVYYNKAQGGTKRAATQVASLFGDSAVGRMPLSLDTLSNGAPVTVIVGSTFKGSLAQGPPVSHTPVRQPPYVASNPGATLPLLKHLPRVPFRLELPSVLERASLPDDGPGEVAVRRYKIDRDHWAVRLTYTTGGIAPKYWGIEETDWADAPILQGPNTEVRLHGRTFQLYYSGANLHMVVLRQDGATYWVVNDLLDDLSTETMLAIAEGLHPLPR